MSSYSSLDGKQQEKILVGLEPRAENPASVILKRKTDLPGLSCGRSQQRPAGPGCSKPCAACWPVSAPDDVAQPP